MGSELRKQGTEGQLMAQASCHTGAGCAREGTGKPLQGHGKDGTISYLLRKD